MLDLYKNRDSKIFLLGLLNWYRPVKFLKLAKLRYSSGLYNIFRDYPKDMLIECCLHEDKDVRELARREYKHRKYGVVKNVQSMELDISFELTFFYRYFILGLLS